MSHQPYDQIQPILKHLEGLVYRNPPKTIDGSGRTWKEHAIEGDEVLSMVADALEAAGCCHGHRDKGATPPMMYPEWIMCAVSHREQKTKELTAEIEKLRKIIQKHDLCHDEHGQVGAVEFVEACDNEQRKEYGSAPHADRVQKLEALLKRIEWHSPIFDVSHCPCCNRVKSRGHTEYCELGQVLGEINAPDTTGTTGTGKSKFQDPPGCRQ